MRTPHIIDYAPPKRRNGRRIALAILAVAFLLLAEEIGRQVYLPRYEQRRAAARSLKLRLDSQVDCLANQDPPGILVYTTDLKRAGEVGERPAGSKLSEYFIRRDGSEIFASIHLPWYSELGARLGNTPRGPIGTVFMSGRHVAGGTPRLVVVDVTDGNECAVFLCSVITPGPAQLSNRTNIQVPTLRKFTPDHSSLSIFAAQPDAHDPAAFTIRCVTTPKDTNKKGEEEDLIDGRLNADDTVSLTPRRGWMPTTDMELLKPDGTPLTPWDGPERKQFGGGPRR